ncbi:MAG TPA: enoyl-CoA hydratase-related protein [Mycobacteriales bacterium]|nr:enoyl-CoA hydratase-related protein [Mycobacteriales bacterium]
MPSLSRDGDVFVLDLGSDENRFTPDWLEGVERRLDEVLAAEPRALVTTATGKFFSNGLDLEGLGQNPEGLAPYVRRVHALFARLLTFPAPTVAAMQGHVFAAGAMLALAHDWRVMRADRGYFCLPEVDIQIPFTPGMDALIRCKLTPSTAIDAMTTGRRYGGGDALAAGIVDEAVDESDVVPRAVERVRPLAGKDSRTLGVIKQRMFAGVVRELLEGELGF